MRARACLQVPASAPQALQGMSLLHYIVAHILENLPTPKDAHGHDATFPSESMARSAAARQYIQRVRADLGTLLRFNISKVDMSVLAEQLTTLVGRMRELLQVRTSLQPPSDLPLTSLQPPSDLPPTSL